MVRAKAGDSGNLWITAISQSSGKGRRGNRWVSPPGNLYASLLLVEVEWSKNVSTLSFVAANALFDAISQVCGIHTPELQLKWPNDILLNEAKIAGILLEKSTMDNGDEAIVIGWGVNCLHHPDKTPYKAGNLKLSGFDVTPERLFDALVKSMADHLDRWNQGSGFAATRETWMQRARGIGRKITVRLPQAELHGIFQAIDHEGRLELLTGNGSIEKISAGDVFFGSNNNNKGNP